MKRQKQACRSWRLIGGARQNPAWSNNILERNMDAIRAVAPAALPIAIPGAEYQAKEYGIGAYGVVLPTTADGIVLKLTSDRSEARVAYLISQMRDKPAGIVRYHLAGKLDGTQHIDGRDAPVWGLWRDEAYNVGRVHLPTDTKNLLDDIFSSGERLLESWVRVPGPNRKETASMLVALAKRYLKKQSFIDEIDRLSRVGGLERTLQAKRMDERNIEAVALASYLHFSEHLARDRQGRFVGETMISLADRGILLTDVRETNVGLDADGHMIVTDPGMAIFLDRELDQLDVPMLKDYVREPTRSNPAGGRRLHVERREMHGVGIGIHIVDRDTNATASMAVFARMFHDTKDHVGLEEFLRGSKRVAYIGEVFVPLAARHAGVGAMLVRALIDRARKLKADRVYLHASSYESEPEKLERFYERLGFQHVGRYHGTPIMGKLLTRS